MYWHFSFTVSVFLFLFFRLRRTAGNVKKGRQTYRINTMQYTKNETICADDQISYVGHEHVDHSAVSDAIASHILFIHGNRVDEGNIASLKATSAKNEATQGSEIDGFEEGPRIVRRLQKWRKQHKWKDRQNDEEEPKWKKTKKYKSR